LKQIVFWREYVAAERRQMGGAMLHPLFMPLAGNGQGHSLFLRACITEDALPQAAYAIKQRRCLIA